LKRKINELNSSILKCAGRTDFERDIYADPST
jgi:hypothetical protein